MRRSCALGEKIVLEGHRPRLPLFDSGDPNFASSADEVPAGRAGRDELD
ncbi:hypothetical protein [Nonomuraea sp. CA-141351]